MNIEITEKAQIEIKSLLSKEVKGSFFRISVEGGGCSGFKYKFSIDQIVNCDDLKIKNILIDQTSFSFIEGSKLEYIDNLIEKSFKISNPKATSSCGCGTSFSI